MKRPEEPSELDWSLLAAMEAVSVLVRADAARDLREERLTPGGVTLLELVQLQPGETSSGLAAQLGVTRQAASKAVAVLLEEGLLETRASTEDARALRITVTAAGRRAPGAGARAGAAGGQRGGVAANVVPEGTRHVVDVDGAHAHGTHRIRKRAHPRHGVF